jgi:hypothetical protein
MARDTAYWYSRGRGCLWAKAASRLLVRTVETKRVDAFAEMTDEELDEYVNGKSAGH